MLKVGEAAPDFELQSDSGETVRLADLRGKKVILYFYPKDNTPGCTTEACEFRDRAPQIKRKGAVVLGVSPDSIKSHERFKQKYELPFALLSDPDHAVAERYGAWGEKKMYGKTYEGILRTTYLIDEKGRVEEVFEKVKAKGHGDQVMDSLSR
ncbi:MAG: thioredoxin-dependent thiol peroxidase [Gemmatimonadota bacterium]|nr:MAG: thioredoxin-dependent thiol peroxidase [Gemmatimonadota bacterium]